MVEDERREKRKSESNEISNLNKYFKPSIKASHFQFPFWWKLFSRKISEIFNFRLRTNEGNRRNVGSVGSSGVITKINSQKTSGAE